MKKTKPNFYFPPIDKDGNPYFVPLVVKNKEILMASLKATRSIMDVANYTSADIDLNYSSDRFNEILRYSERIIPEVETNDFKIEPLNDDDIILELTETETEEFEKTYNFKDVMALDSENNILEINDFEDANEKEYNNNIENGYGIISDCLISLECDCGMYYGFKSESEIPNENVNCVNCNRLLIDYTKKDDSYYKFLNYEEYVKLYAKKTPRKKK